jgi:4-hydroxy-tetrahydrodipicolinate synthase
VNDSVNGSRIRGVLAPVVTPFKRDLSPDADLLARHCRWLLGENVGLAVFGTNSEANSMSVDEKLDLLDSLIAQGIDPARMMPGTGCCAITDSIRLSERAANLGCAGVLMLPPFYYKGVSDEGLFRNFAEIIERVGSDRLRVYLYNIPPVSQVPITVALIERLLKSYPDAVAGVKDSSGDWNNTQAYLDAFREDSFDVFPGSESFLLRGLRNGAAGCISATANVNPRSIAQVCSSWENGDADVRQAQLDTIRGIFAKRPMIPSLKATIARHSGIDSWATVRPPLVELTSAESESLGRDLDDVGFTMPGIQ